MEHRGSDRDAREVDHEAWRREQDTIAVERRRLAELEPHLREATPESEFARSLPPMTSGIPGVSLVAVYRRDRHGRLVVASLALVGVDNVITADTLRQVPLTALENSVNLTLGGDVNRAALADLGPLRREPGMSPEDFSRRVAEHYKLWAAVVPHPAAAMAAENAVKVPTMHGWIREARLRGFLPAARRGKA